MKLIELSHWFWLMQGGLYVFWFWHKHEKVLDEPIWQDSHCIDPTGSSISAFPCLEKTKQKTPPKKPPQIQTTKENPRNNFIYCFSHFLVNILLFWKSPQREWMQCLIKVYKCFFKNFRIHWDPGTETQVEGESISLINLSSWGRLVKKEAMQGKLL